MHQPGAPHTAAAAKALTHRSRVRATHSLAHPATQSAFRGPYTQQQQPSTLPIPSATRGDFPTNAQGAPVGRTMAVAQILKNVLSEDAGESAAAVRAAGASMGGGIASGNRHGSRAASASASIASGSIASASNAYYPSPCASVFVWGHPRSAHSNAPLALLPATWNGAKCGDCSPIASYSRDGTRRFTSQLLC